MSSIKRRAFITLHGGAAAAWPLAARAQPAKKIPRIGVLWPNPPATFDFMRQGLNDLGYVEGRNMAFEFRWAEGKQAGNRGHRDRRSRGIELPKSSPSFRKGFLSFSRRPILLAGDERTDTRLGLRAILSALAGLIPPASDD